MLETICDVRCCQSSESLCRHSNSDLRYQDAKSGSQIWATAATRFQGSCEISAAAMVLTVNAIKKY